MSSIFYLIFSYSVLLIFIIMAFAGFIGIFVYYKKSKRNQKSRKLMRKSFEQGDTSKIDLNGILNRQAEYLPYNKMFEFPVDKLITK